MKLTISWCLHSQPGKLVCIELVSAVVFKQVCTLFLLPIYGWDAQDSSFSCRLYLPFLPPIHWMLARWTVNNLSVTFRVVAYIIGLCDAPTNEHYPVHPCFINPLYYIDIGNEALLAFSE